MNEIANRRNIAPLATLLLSLAGLLVAFLLSLGAAQRYFGRAAAAQDQLAAVARIEALVAAGYPKGQLTEALADYRASITRETVLLVSPAEKARQERERLAADRLAVLAFVPENRPQFIRLISRIGEQERSEVADVAAAMARLRLRTTILALSLAGAAFGAIVAGMTAVWSVNRRLAREVQARTAELQVVDQSRRLFFAKASHELRTPITVMRGEAEVSLCDPHADIDALRESLRHVVTHAAFLNRRVDELLSLSKADDGQLSLAMVPTDLSDLVRDTAEVASAYARSADVRIDFTVPREPAPVVADVRWLGQALLAILDNGVKFSPQGGVLKLRLDNHDGEASIVVIDDGPGLMAEALPHVFDAYYQTEAGKMRGGTGLGLALARWVVERHGGTIMAANEPQGGCRIGISLPMRKAA